MDYSEIKIMVKTIILNYESVTKPYSRNTYTSKVESVNSLELFKKIWS